MISVVIPVKDGGEDLRRCLAGIRAQRLEDEVEIVVVDSGSCDGSVELARSAGARVHEIAPARFNHGATRNLAAELARGEVLVFTSQDAYAPSERWLAALTAPLAQDGSLAGTYGRQIAHVEATPPERFFMDFLYGDRTRTQRAAGVHELSMQTTLFSNVNSAIRADVFARFPFVDDIIMSEDQEWSRRVLLAGYALRYVPEAAVHHSHPYTLRQAFRRFFDSGVSSDRAYMAGAGPSSVVLRQQALRYVREELAWLWQSGRRRWIPYSAAYEAAKFAGLQLGIRHGRLPHAVKVRFSALPGYWASHGSH